MDTNTNSDLVSTNLSSMPPMPNMQPINHRSSANKKVSAPLIILAVAVLGFIIWWVSRAPQTEQVVYPTPTPTPVQDEIQTEVDQLDLGDIDQEFEEVDQELNTL